MLQYGIQAPIFATLANQVRQSFRRTIDQQRIIRTGDVGVPGFQRSDPCRLDPGERLVCQKKRSNLSRRPSIATNHWNPDRECRALSFARAFRGNRSSVELDDVLSDRQSKSQPAEATGGSLGVTLEHVGKKIR